MGEIKIVFFDIDGTLVNFHAHQISEKVEEALIRLKNKGIKLVIATGRGPIQLPKFDRVEFDAFLCFNGSYVFDREGLIASTPLAKRDIKQILENSHHLDRPIIMAAEDRLVCNGLDDDLEEYLSFGVIQPEHIDNIEDFSAQKDIYQMMIAGRQHEYDAIVKDVNESKIVAWWDRAMDLIPKASSKGRAVESILKHYHIEKEEAMAFGDGNNDIPLLQAVGHGVAMENASEELKTVAKTTCGHVKDDGVYTYLCEQGII